MSTKRILLTERGVILLETTLHGGFGAEIARGYTLTTKRTPEAWTFDNLPAAEAAFRAEVERCK